MSADLANAIGALGFTARVETQGKLAILTFTEIPTLDAASRRRIVSLARSHGFANVALELQSVDAALPGD